MINEFDFSWIHISLKKTGNRKQVLEAIKDEDGDTKYKYAEIAGVVAHELHHLTQNFDIAIRPKEYSPIVNYFLNPIEIEAFHIGFRAEADISDKTIDACIRKYLDNFLKKRITMKEYEKIRVKWLNPKIKLLKGVK